MRIAVAVVLSLFAVAALAQQEIDGRGTKNHVPSVREKNVAALQSL